MEKKLSCSIVKDLLPNYIEKLTSRETNVQIEEHLSDCEVCTKCYDEMCQEVPNQSVVSEAKDLSRFLRKTKAVAIVKSAVIMLMVIAIVVNIIVDLAINKRITWSIIVIASVILAMGTYALMMWGNAHKFIKGTAFASMMVFPLLWVISNYCNSLGSQKDWLLPIAYPICCIWLVIIWVPIFLYKCVKCSLWTSIGSLFVLVIPGNIWTNAIAHGISFREQMTSFDSFINTTVYGFFAIIIFIIAYLRRGVRKK